MSNEEKSFPKVQINWEITTYGKLVRMSFAENVPTADDCLTRVLENLYT